MTRLFAFGVCLLAVRGLMMSCVSAEKLYFPQSEINASWADAQRYCQRCFSELVTLTPENIQNIARRLSSEHWIGLRKRPLSIWPNSTLYSYNDTTTFWSRWVNGDLLTFQNWYPGYPVFKSPYPRKQCCACSCTCPAQPSTTTPFTFKPATATTNSNAGTWNTTGQNTSTWTQYLPPNSTTTSSSQWSTHSGPSTTVLPMSTVTNSSISNSTTISSTTQYLFTTAAPFTPVESECVSKPMLFHDLPDPDENYIEDSCVAMLSFGTWVERNCSMLLPFICAEDRFEGIVNATHVNSTSADISWDRGPDTISHYRVLVNGAVREENYTDTTCSLSNLTSGTLYSVQVFPVKCGRSLNPAQGTFYTVPHKVKDLKVTNQTETCVSLNWTSPEGNVDLYFVQTKEGETSTKTESAVVCGLTPGSLHTFNVSAGVKDQSRKSEIFTIAAHTKPAQVLNLSTSNVTETSMILKWDAPEGGAKSYRVSTSWEGKEPNTYTNNTAGNELTIKDLPSGTKITLSVTALSTDTLEGKSQTVFCYTRPDNISNLNLASTEDTITATWNISKGSPRFTVKLSPPEGLEETLINTSDSTCTFVGLKSAANYTVTVYKVAEESRSDGVNKSIFTRPHPPRDAVLSHRSKNSLTITWTPPKNTQTVQYSVTLNSSFWGQEWKTDLNNITTYTFDNLNSGSNYTFYVQTKAGDLLSDAETLVAATESEKREITLSVVCSSNQSLRCDDETTKADAFQELTFQFQKVLENHVFWTLKRMDTGDTGN